LERLDNYPFSCTEQKISKAMPYVVLWDRPNLRDSVLRNSKRSLKDQLKLGEETIAEAISAIRASLQYDGVSIWAGSGEANLFVTAYAADFLQTMREHGLGCPADLMERLTNILEEQVNNQPTSIEDGRNKIYAAWILQRDGRIMTSVLTSLEDWFSKNARNWERDVLTSLLADSYASLRLTKRAEARLSTQDVVITNDPLFSTGMARALHALIILQDFSQVRDATPLVANLQDAALRPSATTVDLAMTARALAELSSLKNLGPELSLKLDCASYQPDFFGPQNTDNQEGLSYVSAPGCQRFRVKTDENLDLAVLLTEEGFDRKPAATAQSKGLEVTKQILNNQGLPVKQLELGEVVTSKICARSLGRSVPNAVILDLVPGGLEPVIEKTPLEQGEGFMRYERREDRGIFFVNLTPEERCYEYRLRAATKGHFVVPATQVEGMYQPELNATSGGSSLDIQ
ncbi:MAG: hypothetical protein IJU40_02210, partial [Desulfovibrionaceae bacterium]|nr:hypothetical protein [Desulfovibrionaceae bacterium]